MTGAMNRRVQAELDRLVAQTVLTPAERERIGERYATAPWDMLVLARWFTILGGVTAGVGTVILAKEYVNALRLGEVGLALATVVFIALGRFVVNAKGLVKAGAALEMMGGFALQGLIFLLAIDFSRGSKNWPALIGFQALLLAMLAYLLKNRLVLIHAAVCLFVFFGGETGYVSGWGAYWLEMTYPMRYLVMGFVFLGAAWIHATELKGAYQSFARVYEHLGLLDIHLAFWFLSLFGYFEDPYRWSGTTAERLLFSALWALVSAASLWLAGVTGQRMLRTYGLTFLVINVYTFYFQFVAENSPEIWWIHLLLVGGTLVWIGFALERRMRRSSQALPGQQI